MGVWLFGRLPTSFLPEEDQGYLIVSVQLPPGATTNRRAVVVKQARIPAKKTRQHMVSVLTVTGFFGGAARTRAWPSSR